MASSRGTSNGPDWLDLAEMMRAFEDQNKVRIEICFVRWTSNELADLSVVAKAWDLGADRRVARPLGLVNATYRAGLFKSLEGLITYLLYQLDFQLAEFEWGRANAASAEHPAH